MLKASNQVVKHDAEAVLDSLNNAHGEPENAPSLASSEGGLSEEGPEKAGTSPQNKRNKRHLQHLQPRNSPGSNQNYWLH